MINNKCIIDNSEYKIEHLPKDGTSYIFYECNKDECEENDTININKVKYFLNKKKFTEKLHASFDISIEIEGFEIGDIFYNEIFDYLYLNLENYLNGDNMFGGNKQTSNYLENQLTRHEDYKDIIDKILNNNKFETFHKYAEIILRKYNAVFAEIAPFIEEIKSYSEDLIKSKRIIYTDGYQQIINKYNDYMLFLKLKNDFFPHVIPFILTVGLYNWANFIDELITKDYNINKYGYIAQLFLTGYKKNPDETKEILDSIKKFSVNSNFTTNEINSFIKQSYQKYKSYLEDSFYTLFKDNVNSDDPDIFPLKKHLGHDKYIEKIRDKYLTNTLTINEQKELDILFSIMTLKKIIDEISELLDNDDNDDNEDIQNLLETLSSINFFIEKIIEDQHYLPILNLYHYFLRKYFNELINPYIPNKITKEKINQFSSKARKEVLKEYKNQNGGMITREKYLIMKNKYINLKKKLLII